MTEAWRDVVGYEGLYQVSDQGRVRRGGRVRKLHLRKDGYQTVGLSKGGKITTHWVHRLVLIAFRPNPMNLAEGDHRNGLTADNRLDNLRWASRSRNVLDRHRAHGAVPVIGVSSSGNTTNPFRARLQIEGKQVHLGVYPTADAAGAARNEALKGLCHA